MLIETSLLGTAAGSIGPISLTYNTLMLWPLSVILGKRIQDRGLQAKRYIRHARIWFLMLSAAIAGAALGENRLFVAMFAIIMVYQFAYLKVLIEVLRSFWLPSQDHDSEFGPRPA
jgi:hypothetical protein